MNNLLALIACMITASIFSAPTFPPPLSRESAPRENTRTDNQQPPKAVIKFKPQPHYPKKAREQQAEATIVLRAIFRASGAITDIKFEKVIPTDLPEDMVRAFTEECI